eukprot:SAG31_NODE_120_length_23892_cov_10.545623_3_plen_147_part_00
MKRSVAVWFHATDQNSVPHLWPPVASDVEVPYHYALTFIVNSSRRVHVRHLLSHRPRLHNLIILHRRFGVERKTVYLCGMWAANVHHRAGRYALPSRQCNPRNVLPARSLVNRDDLCIELKGSACVDRLRARRTSSWSIHMDQTHP